VPTKPDILILDVDGVLLDSNTIKERNIASAAAPYLSKDRLKKFISYFTGLNGIPREKKVRDFFREENKTASQILLAYDRLNEQNLHQAEKTPGCREFLERWSKACPLYALSGGEQTEVRGVLKGAKIDSFFKGIYGGPMTKQQHLESLSFQGKVVFIGDSLYDAEVAEQFNFTFVFMYQFSQFSDWKSYFQARPYVEIIKNLEDWS